MSLLGAMLKTYKADSGSRENMLKKQRLRFEKLVRYAKENSIFYRKQYAKVPDNFSLEDLPPVTKPELMANLDSVLTDPNVNMERIRSFTGNQDNIGRMLDGKYLVFKTSGSTGNPVMVLYDKDAIDVSSAVAAFRTFARKDDYEAFMRHGKKTAGVFADHGFYLACGMSRYLQLKYPLKKTKITVDVNSPEEEIIRELNAFQPSMLSGYPSNLALLADLKDLKIHPDVVITGGELLTDPIRKKISERFGCYVQTHYSCTEGGEIACECCNGHLHINEDWIILEPVDKNNRPVGFGVMSDKVLITNLSNYIQPFIRYELTDRVIVHNEKCGCGRDTLWLEIEGRTDDVLEFGNGVRIAPMSLYKILEEVEEIRRFQLVQKASDLLDLRVIADQKQQAFEKASKALKEYFDSKGINNIRVLLSDELPQTDKVSGKFKHIYADCTDHE